MADYLLQAAGADNLSPWTFQADVTNGTDPSPQDVAIQRSAFTQRKVIGYVPQRLAIDPDMPLRARGVVALGIDPARLLAAHGVQAVPRRRGAAGSGCRGLRRCWGRGAAGDDRARRRSSCKTSRLAAGEPGLDGAGDGPGVLGMAPTAA